MTHRSPRAPQSQLRKTRRRSAPAVIGLTLLLLFFTLMMGLGLAQALEPNRLPATKPVVPTTSPSLSASPPARPTASPSSTSPTPTIGTVDPVSDRDRLGQELYLENCATCHLGIPPAVLPTQTWQVLLQDPQHYGLTVNLPQDPERRFIWNYLKGASRPTGDKQERIPYRVADSRYFRALHPKVKLTEKVKPATCISCHPSAQSFNFRQLTPSAEASP